MHTHTHTCVRNSDVWRFLTPYILSLLNRIILLCFFFKVNFKAQQVFGAVIYCKYYRYYDLMICLDFRRDHWACQGWSNFSGTVDCAICFFAFAIVIHCVLDADAIVREWSVCLRPIPRSTYDSVLVPSVTQSQLLYSLWLGNSYADTILRKEMFLDCFGCKPIDSQLLTAVKPHFLILCCILR